MAAVDTTGYHLASPRFETAQQVMDNAVRISAIRRQGWKLPPAKPVSNPILVAPSVPEKPKLLLYPNMASIVEALGFQFGATSDEIFTAIGSCPATGARECAAALYARFEFQSRAVVCKAFGITDRALIDGLRLIDRVLIEHQVSAFSPLAIVAQLIHQHWLNGNNGGRCYRIEDIQAAICEHFKLKRNDLLSHRRTANVVGPRQLGMALAKHLTLRSLPEIGRRFDGRDHTTVLHAVRKLQPAIEAAAAEIEQGAPLAIWIEIANKHVEAMQLNIHRDIRHRAEVL